MVHDRSRRANRPANEITVCPHFPEWLDLDHLPRAKADSRKTLAAVRECIALMNNPSNQGLKQRQDGGQQRALHAAPQQVGAITAALDVPPGPPGSSRWRRSHLVDPDIKWLRQVERRPSTWACKETALCRMLDS